MENRRETEAPVDPQFPDRWSPRAFADEPLNAGHVSSLLEAARWAPSCLNEQPWVFFWALSEEDRARFGSALNAGNRVWACKAPLLLFVASRKTFARNGRPNRHAGFDAGAAWLSLALQARKLGLYAHAMAGFDPDRAFEVLGLPRQDHEIFAAVAVGRLGNPDDLPEEQRAREKPSSRKPLSDVGWEGAFPKG